MGDFVYLDLESVQPIWNSIQKSQIIFHPVIAPDGVINKQKFFFSENNKPYMLFIDRNILISLLKFCENGSLKDNAESKKVGLLFAWAALNGIPVSAGFAVMERSASIHSQEEGLVELGKYLEVTEKYSTQLWIDVATGRKTEIPKITFSMKPAPNVTADYASGSDHYDMAVASLLHMVYLFRNNSMSPTEKIKEFFLWMCDNLLVSEYLLVYVTLVFMGKDGAKAPKNANSNSLEKVIAGCRNQAWDISYLTLWSTFYTASDQYKEEFLFATNDILLKRIFVNKHGPGGFWGFLNAALPTKDFQMLQELIEEKMFHRIKPNFGDNPQDYFHALTEKEINRLAEHYSLD